MAHTAQPRCRNFVDRPQLPARHRRDPDGRVQDVGRARVDAVGSGTVDFGRDVKARQRGTDQCVLAARLQRRMLRRAVIRGLHRELSEPETPARGMADATHRSVQGVARDIEARQLPSATSRGLRPRRYEFRRRRSCALPRSLLSFARACDVRSSRSHPPPRHEETWEWS